METKEFDNLVQENGMLWYLALILAIAILFYLAIPGIGAFLVREQWRLFRKRITEVSRYPMLNPRAPGRERNAFIGYFRFFGTLEAIQGDDRIWITNGAFSVAADLHHGSLTMLPAASPGQSDEDSELRVVPWSRVFSLPEGTPILVGGALFSEDGRGVFGSRGKVKPLVVIHDCKREHIVQRAIWSGRQRNEYWNQFTIPSIIAGSFILFLLAYSSLVNPDLRVPAIVALAMCLAPVSPFLPPAFPLYFLYRSFWKKARLMRAQRDVVMLPMRYFPPARPRDAPPRERREQRATLLPDLEPYVMLRGREQEGDPGAIVCAGETVQLPAETRRIALTLPRAGARRMRGGGESFAFGAYSDEGDGILLRRPEDPMAELIVVPGDPEDISEGCGRAARLYEIVSAVFIGLNVALNMAGILILLTLLIG